MNIPKLIFIVPYRDRENEKHHFSIYMNYIMEDYDKNDYEIYYSHQCDKRLFNRGAIKNIGFLVLKEKYPQHYKNITFVFNDVDTLPIKKNILHYETSKNIVKHFYGFTFALGGIFSIKGEDFEKCNGFSNNWGWGLEDNIMNNRCLKNNIKIDRNNFYKIGDHNILQIVNTPFRHINDDDVTNYKKKLYTDDLFKIHDIKYNIQPHNIGNYSNLKTINEYMINITNFNCLVNPDDNKMYYKNLSKDNKVEYNYLNKQNHRKKWNLSKFML
tara:strand:- start:2384 stop:3196 length:813 start_codon:yes stop_codon:yes gene_type:complete